MELASLQFTVLSFKLKALVYKLEQVSLDEPDEIQLPSVRPAAQGCFGDPDEI